MEYALRFSFEATNNEVEYESMVAGLELVRSLGVRQILVRGDSKLMMDQIWGDCGIKNKSLVRYHAKATTLEKDFTRIVFEHIPRTKNEEADRLSKLATTYYDELPKEVYFEVRDRKACEEIPTKAVLEEYQDWRTDIAKFLQDGLLPADSIKARKIQQRILRFCVYEGELYRKSFEGPLLLCISQGIIQKLLYEVHSGWCGIHIGGRSLATKITRTGFFWPAMVKDSADFVQKCIACQKLGNVPHQSSTTMTPIISHIPFLVWGIDLVEKLPKAKGSA
ncbi:hypothetical protein LIER_04120 [Lithospermum erythrorhizon]|uniref:Uncharacterized protein n=1 Tax=Lithospermum erythrorhizon TaxID=34254 RepID=A0AAV3P0C1_LITER